MSHDPQAPERTSAQVELESKLAYQEKAISDLNESVVEQTKALLSLEQRVKTIEQVLRRLSCQLEAMETTPSAEKPPHY